MMTNSNTSTTKREIESAALSPIFIASRLLNAGGEVFAFSTTREGGCSRGVYASMNCCDYCGDLAENVETNRHAVASCLSIDDADLVIPTQTHSCNIAVVDSFLLSKDAVDRRKLLTGVDALVTKEKRICIGINTADCLPILIFSPDKEVVAAVHAGWKGTLGRIAQKTVRLMEMKYSCCPNRMKVYIGPSISMNAYEVGKDLCDLFSKSKFDLGKYTLSNTFTQKKHLNLWKINADTLVEAGISPNNLEISGICTWSNSDLFFSARKIGVESGRILSGIMIK